MNARRFALALSLVAASAAADPPRLALPATPWSRVDAFPVGGAGVYAPLLLPDGRAVVFTHAPSTVAVIDPASGTVRSSPLEEPASDRAPFEPRVDARGRIVVLGQGGTLFRLGLDGRVRVAAPLPDGPIGIVARADGTEVAVASSNDRVEFVTLRADGSVAAVRVLGSNPVATPVPLGRDRVVTGVPNGLAVLDPTGAARLLPGVSELHHLVNFGPAALAITDAAAFPVDADGVVGPPRALPGRTRWWIPTPDGGALGWLDAPPGGLLRVDPGGEVRRIDASPLTAAASVDDAGAMLLVSREGRLTALEADGSRRWVLDLQRRIVTRVTLAPDGEAWVTTADGDALRLSNRPPSAQEAPRANR